MRDVSYRNIGSAGAMTLIALAWQLALFKLAIDEGYPHPGFLMIDSPQKNLTPEGSVREDEFGDPAIGSHVWDHLLALAEQLRDRGQLVVVDNRPRRRRTRQSWSATPASQAKSPTPDRQRTALARPRTPTAMD